MLRAVHTLCGLINLAKVFSSDMGQLFPGECTVLSKDKLGLDSEIGIDPYKSCILAEQVNLAQC